MRVNVYAEEITDRVEIVAKHIDGQEFTGCRFYLEMPVTVGESTVRGPFRHRPGDDDSSAVTFWGKQDLRPALRKALDMLDRHYAQIQGAGQLAGQPVTVAGDGRNYGEGQDPNAEAVKEIAARHGRPKV